MTSAEKQAFNTHGTEQSEFCLEDDNSIASEGMDNKPQDIELSSDDENNDKEEYEIINMKSVRNSSRTPKNKQSLCKMIMICLLIVLLYTIVDTSNAVSFKRAADHAPYSPYFIMLISAFSLFICTSLLLILRSLFTCVTTRCSKSKIQHPNNDTQTSDTDVSHSVAILIAMLLITYQTGIFFASARTPGILQAALQHVDIPMSMLLSLLFLRKRYGACHIIAVLVILFGVVITLLNPISDVIINLWPFHEVVIPSNGTDYEHSNSTHANFMSVLQHSISHGFNPMLKFAVVQPKQIQLLVMRSRTLNLQTMNHTCPHHNNTMNCTCSQNVNNTYNNNYTQGEEDYPVIEDDVITENVATSWSILYMLAFVPFVIINIVTEKTFTNRPNTDKLKFLFRIGAYALPMNILACLVNFMLLSQDGVASWEKISEHFVMDLLCLMNQIPSSTQWFHCNTFAIDASVYAIFYVLSALMSIWLISVTSANFNVLVETISTPTAIFVFYLFDRLHMEASEKVYFSFEIVIGVVVICFGLLIYTYTEARITQAVKRGIQLDNSDEENSDHADFVLINLK